MAYKVQKPCKICGKMYTPCFDCEQDKTTFHWRTVACSEECGKKFLKLVLEDRAIKNISESPIEVMANDIEIDEDKPQKIKKLIK